MNLNVTANNGKQNKQKTQAVSIGSNKEEKFNLTKNILKDSNSKTYNDEIQIRPME